MGAYLIVRAEVKAAADIDAFERWYDQKHLGDAVAAFGAAHAWRGWSDVDKHVHYAFYAFESLEAARAIKDSDAIKALIAEFDQTWGERVVRTRDVVEDRQRLSSA